MVTVVNEGLEYQARYTNQSTAGSWKWIALGSGSTAEGTSQTALVTELTTNGGERALATLAYEASYKSTWVKVFAFTGAATVRECGIFDQLAVGGHMLMRHVFAGDKVMGNGDTLQVTMKLTQST
jgi:hypothetical protein